jgi:hypothetical protein
MIPVLARTEYSLDTIKSYSSGQSEIPGANCIREGVVIRSITDRVTSKGGRPVYKYLSDDYLLNSFSTNNTENNETTDI